MTLLIVPAILGLPLLLITARPWWSGLTVALNRKAAADLSVAERAWIGVCAGAGIVTFVACAALGFNDLDTAVDGLAWLAFALMIGASTAGAVGLIRAATARSTV